MICLLCNGDTTMLLQKENPERGDITYWQCQAECGLAFLDAAHRLSPEQEKQRYDLHNNDPHDAGYQEFIQRLTSQLIPKLTPGARGLDFGSGPGPALSSEMQRHGFECVDYDPFYAPDQTQLEKQYDFITATEVFEHLYNPRETLNQLSVLLKPNGILAVMTETMTSPEAFETWWYHTDPTHVCFYSKKTLQWIADMWGWTVERPNKNITFFSVPTTP